MQPYDHHQIERIKFRDAPDGLIESILVCM